MQKIRAMLAPWLTPRPRVDRGAAMWAALARRERKQLAKAAQLDAGRYLANWNDLNDVERAALVAAWARLVEWVKRVELSVEQAGRR